MVKPVGGRGKTAPYETTHVRVPVPIKDEVDKLVTKYRDSLIPGNEYKDDSKILSFTEALEVSQKIIKGKKGARESLAKLLTAIYNQKVQPSDL